MNLDDLRTAQVEERGTDSLQPRRPSFYADAAAYLDDLRERRDRVADRVDDPFDSEEVRRLTDELETAEEVVESIYDRRVGKLVKRASLAAAGMPADEEGLTTEERALFGDLVERIEASRSEVLATLDGEDEGAMGGGEAPDTASAPEPPPDEPVEEPGDAVEDAAVDGATAEPPAEPASDQHPEPDGGSATAEPTHVPGDDPTEATGAAPTDAPGAAPTEDTDRLTVRITASVGEIYGVDDRVYTLDAEDVVTLPEPNARPLLERGAAQRVE